MSKPATSRRPFLKLAVAVTLVAASGGSFAQQAVTLLNVSYDPTRALYVEFNAAFSQYWKAKTGQDVTIKQSHGGSGKLTRSIIDGLDADVATMALAGDVDALHPLGGWIPKDWQKRLPHHSSPYSNTIIFAVREGNPKDVRDWDDLIRADIKVITPNPKTLGGARWNYLAAWEFAKRKYGTRAVALACLEYLYTEEGQDIAGKNLYRPAVSDKAKAQYAKQFAKTKLFTIGEEFGGWEKADKDHFADGGSSDQIYTKT